MATNAAADTIKALVKNCFAALEVLSEFSNFKGEELKCLDSASLQGFYKHENKSAWLHCHYNTTSFTRQHQTRTNVHRPPNMQMAEAHQWSEGQNLYTACKEGELMADLTPPNKGHLLLLDSRTSVHNVQGLCVTLNTRPVRSPKQYQLLICLHNLQNDHSQLTVK